MTVAIQQIRKIQSRVVGEDEEGSGMIGLLGGWSPREPMRALLLKAHLPPLHPPESSTHLFFSSYISRWIGGLMNGFHSVRNDFLWIFEFVVRGVFWATPSGRPVVPLMPGGLIIFFQLRPLSMIQAQKAFFHLPILSDVGLVL